MGWVDYQLFMDNGYKDKIDGGTWGASPLRFTEKEELGGMASVLSVMKVSKTAHNKKGMGAGQSKLMVDPVRPGGF